MFLAVRAAAGDHPQLCVGGLAVDPVVREVLSVVHFDGVQLVDGGGTVGPGDLDPVAPVERAQVVEDGRPGLVVDVPRQDGGAALAGAGTAAVPAREVALGLGRGLEVALRVQAQFGDRGVQPYGRDADPGRRGY